MSTILEVDDTGSLMVPVGDLLDTAPHAKFLAQAVGNGIMIRPVGTQPDPFWKTASPQERAADILNWAQQHQDGPGLSSAATGRDSIYD